MTAFNYPETAADALAAWDRGELVWTVELGGLGPGYEQAIHVTVFEIIRDVDRSLATDERSEEFQRSADATVHRISEDGYDLGLSGAQVTVATRLAYRTLRDGWRVTLEAAKKHNPKQLTMVSRAWPRVEIAEKVGG